MTSRASLGLLAVAAGACVVVEPTPEVWPDFGGLDAFVAEAQPVLAGRCANPSCHGDPARPLALYAVHRHRLDPADTYLDAPLDEAELAHNFRQTGAFLLEVTAAEASLLLTKPLSVASGGSGHTFGAVFADTDDDGYRTLRAWARAALAP